MVAGALLVVAGIGAAWWLMGSELRAHRPATDVSLGPPSDERVRTERRVGGLLQTPIEGDPPGASPEPPGVGSDRPPARWEWVDRERGIARIPIERAIELVIERYGEEGGAEGAGEPEPVEIGPPSLDERPGERPEGER